MGSKTFIKITNRDIFEKLGGIEKHLEKLNVKSAVHSWAIGIIVLLIVALFKIAA